MTTNCSSPFNTGADAKIEIRGVTARCLLQILDACGGLLVDQLKLEAWILGIEGLFVNVGQILGEGCDDSQLTLGHPWQLEITENDSQLGMAPRLLVLVIPDIIWKIRGRDRPTGTHKVVGAVVGITNLHRALFFPATFHRACVLLPSG